MAKVRNIVLMDKPGERVLLLGNEAIARGALEANIAVYAAYPGTPSSELTDTMAMVAQRQERLQIWHKPLYPAHSVKTTYLDHQQPL